MPGPTSKDPRKREPAWVKIPLDSEVVCRSSTRADRAEKQRKLEQQKKDDDARRKEELEAAQLLAQMWEMQDKASKSKRQGARWGEEQTEKKESQEPLDLSRKNEAEGGRWQVVEEKKESTWRPKDGVDALLERTKAAEAQQTKILNPPAPQGNFRGAGSMTQEEMRRQTAASLSGSDSSGRRRFRETDDDHGSAWQTVDEPVARSNEATSSGSGFSRPPPRGFAAPADIRKGAKRKDIAMAFGTNAFGVDDEEEEREAVRRELEARNKRPRHEIPRPLEATMDKPAALSNNPYAHLNKEQVFMELAKFKKSCKGKSYQLPADLKARVAEVSGASMSMMGL